ncbi:hypothetical protein ATANTOWER_020411 [Ataeniobius toweri]|uniref:Uncharacterized protein n=1 Tax=Ataeniobius toweri TaxID=208326 RepID=A0ABU7A7S4_9TELE|nr:hypothetical protein [Ataeniobius toweri]
MGTAPQVSFIPEKSMKRHLHSTSSTHNPCSKHLRRVLPPPHSEARWQGKGPAQCYPSSRPEAQQGRQHRAPRPQQNPRLHTKTGQTHPARGPRPAASTRGWPPPPRPRNDTDTPHHCHCNDGPGRNIIQLNSTTAAQPIRYTLPHQAGQPAPPPKRSHISINTAHCLAKTPPTDRPDPDQKARSLSRPPTPDGKQQMRVYKDPKPTSALPLAIVFYPSVLLI